MYLNKEQAVRLESLIDSVGLAELLCDVAEICREKAEHLRHSWQSPLEATAWDRAASRIEKINVAV